MIHYLTRNHIIQIRFLRRRVAKLILLYERISLNRLFQPTSELKTSMSTRNSVTKDGIFRSVTISKISTIHEMVFNQFISFHPLVVALNKHDKKWHEIISHRLILKGKLLWELWRWFLTCGRLRIVFAHHMIFLFQNWEKNIWKYINFFQMRFSKMSITIFPRVRLELHRLWIKTSDQRVTDVSLFLMTFK